MKPVPVVIKAEYKYGFIVRLVFNDGQGADVDLERFLHGPVFEPLRDSSYFKKFFLDGWSIAWPNGADIAPEALYDMVRAQNAA